MKKFWILQENKKNCTYIILSLIFFRMQDDRLSPRSSWDVRDRVCRNIFQENNAGYIPQGHSNRYLIFFTATFF